MKLKIYLERFFSRNYLGEYDALLKMALDHGYVVTSLKDYRDRVLCGGDMKSKFLVLRHDVDINNVEGNQAFFDIEKKYNVKATYYFRFFSLNSHLLFIQQLFKCQFEVGYHYEEVADLAKKFCWTRIGDVDSHRKDLVLLFCSNLDRFCQKVGRKVFSVCSHGDWMNRKLGCANYYFVSQDLLDQLGLEFDAYQHSLMDSFNVYVSDVGARGQFWRNGYSLSDSIRNGHQRIYFLSHERSWGSSFFAERESDFIVLFERVFFEVRLFIRALFLRKKLFFLLFVHPIMGG